MGKNNLEKTSEELTQEEAFEKYKYDIKKYLMDCAWRYSAESAEWTINHYINNVKEAFEKGDSVEDIALDIGYTCG